MFTRFSAFTFIAGLLTSCSVIAKDCSQESTALAVNDCLSARYAAADKALNAVYAQAVKELPNEQKILLKSSQIAWLRYRDASYAFVIEANKDARSYGATVVAEYKAKLVEKRVLELRHLLVGPEGPVVDW